ncbi:putative Thymidylate synthase thyX [Sulfolobus monocaudavirus SMV3]|uniref:thymidylate synthase n=1 Tax=Sulfolobus monocaudavirus SMV3 TaxID=1732177 RepID=UPI000706CFFE|nr:thymidylate synthase [Sulfolobus monocaudavirus SMV3]ALG96996.1 putative Thymidylate synthase thyX [Sulfolobus monocaudavirus SMV3]
MQKPVDEYYQPVIPPSTKNRARQTVEEAYREAYNHYYKLLEAGVPEEDARYVLPNGVNTNIVVTMNARELYNFFALRLCSRTQWEIRQVAWKMLEEVKKVHPRLFRYAGANCIIHENFIRDTPITLDELNEKTEFISMRCIEGVPKEGIYKCIQNARTRSS